MSLNLYFPGKGTGFPFPIFERAADGSEFSVVPLADIDNNKNYGPGTWHPLGLTLAQFAELFWRVRKFHLNAELVWQYEAGGGAGTQTEYLSYTNEKLSTISRYSAGRVAEPNELSLHRPLSTAENYLSTMPVGGDGNFSVNFFGKSSGLPAMDFTTWKIGGLYYPSILFQLPSPAGTFVNYSFPYGDRNYPVAAKLDFLGYGEIDLWHADAATVGRYPPYSLTGTASIEPAEYWTWGGRYDSSTGLPP